MNACHRWLCAYLHHLLALPRSSRSTPLLPYLPPGIVGVVKLALILGQQAADPLLHLTAVNPYVASAGGAGVCFLYEQLLVLAADCACT